MAINVELTSEQAHYLRIVVGHDVDELKEVILRHQGTPLGEHFESMLPNKEATLASIEEAIKNRHK